VTCLFLFLVEVEVVQQVPDQTSVPDQTTLITNDADAFALGPIDATTLGRVYGVHVATDESCIFVSFFLCF